MYLHRTCIYIVHYIITTIIKGISYSNLAKVQIRPKYDKNCMSYTRKEKRYNVYALFNQLIMYTEFDSKHNRAGWEYKKE